MDQESRPINILRLRRARLDLGLTLEQVAGSTSVGVSSLSEFENGTREPRLAHLAALAAHYRRPIAWFFEAADPTTTPIVLWRERPPQDLAAGVEAEFLQLCTYYRNLELWCGEELHCSIPSVEGVASEFGYQDAADLASQFRRTFDLGDQPAFALRSVLEEKLGFRIFHLESAPSGTAACSFDATLGRCVLLNPRSVPWRRRYDLAHELFHLLTWTVFRAADGDGSRTPLRKEESLADVFAAQLLMPEEPFRAAVREATRMGGALRHSDFFDVARRFGVSFEAVLWRVHRLFSRREEETERDIEICRALRSALDERPPSEGPLPSRPQRFVALTRKALRQGRISIGRAAEYLGISRREAKELDALAAHDDEVTLDPA